jgi:hypothetical protein
MKAAKVSLGVLAGVVAFGSLTSVFAQAPATRESTQALMSVVSQDVWHARRSSEHNAQMLQAYKAGEDAYFSGDYEKATKKFKEADAMTKNSPNDYGGGAE